MQRLLRFGLLGLLPFLSAWAQDPLHTSTITLSVGGETPTKNYFGESTGPMFNATYEFRLFKYLALDAGYDTMLPAQTNYQYIASFPAGQNLVSYFPTSYFFRPESGRTRVTLLPFGGKGIWPLLQGRLELFVGLGGAYAFHSDYSDANSFLIRESVGGRFGLDAKRRYWVGTSGQYFHNFGASGQQWLTWTADLGIRFGR